MCDPIVPLPAGPCTSASPPLHHNQPRPAWTKAHRCRTSWTTARRSESSLPEPPSRERQLPVPIAYGPSSRLRHPGHRPIPHGQNARLAGCTEPKEISAPSENRRGPICRSCRRAPGSGLQACHVERSLVRLPNDRPERSPQRGTSPPVRRRGSAFWSGPTVLPETSQFSYCSELKSVCRRQVAGPGPAVHCPGLRWAASMTAGWLCPHVRGVGRLETDHTLNRPQEGVPSGVLQSGRIRWVAALYANLVPGQAVRRYAQANGAPALGTIRRGQWTTCPPRSPSPGARVAFHLARWDQTE